MYKALAKASEVLQASTECQRGALWYAHKRLEQKFKSLRQTHRKEEHLQKQTVLTVANVALQVKIWSIQSTITKFKRAEQLARGQTEALTRTPNGLSETNENARLTRILIADDYPVIREGIAAILKREPDLTVVAQAASGQEALELFRIHQPDVGLIDLHMPEMNGIEAITAIKAEFPNARIVMLNTHDSEEEIYQGLQAGAKGYLLKNTPCAELLECIRTVHKGQFYIVPQLGAKLVEWMSSPQLSDREREVLRLMAAGKSNQGIGAALSITESTVKSHINKILSKLQVTDRTQAVLVALRRGIANL